MTTSTRDSDAPPMIYSGDIERYDFLMRGSDQSIEQWAAILYKHYRVDRPIYRVSGTDLLRVDFRPPLDGASHFETMMRYHSSEYQVMVKRALPALDIGEDSNQHREYEILVSKEFEWEMKYKHEEGNSNGHLTMQYIDNVVARSKWIPSHPIVEISFVFRCFPPDRNPEFLKSIYPQSYLRAAVQGLKDGGVLHSQSQVTIDYAIRLLPASSVGTSGLYMLIRQPS